MFGYGESTAEVKGQKHSLVADVDEVVDWVMGNYNSMEDAFAESEKALRLPDAQVIKILDDLTKTVSGIRVVSEGMKNQLITLKEKLEDRKKIIEAAATKASPSMRESYALALSKIGGKLDGKIKTLLDFDFQYLEKFEKDLFASTLEWKEYLVNVDGVLDESLIRNELANRISDHFRENMSKLIEERREKWTGVANVSRSHLVDNHATHDLGFEMIWVKPGTFKMGSPKTSFFRKNAVRDDDESQYQVTLTKGFYLGKHEVTQGQWESVMGSNPSEFKGTNRPVEKVSWNDVMRFCQKLTETARRADKLPAGMAYQLPTEAQWEYACRAGTTTKYSWGDTIAKTNANYEFDGFVTGLTETTEVGKYQANAWGFHDMHGNVSEWCADWYGDYPSRSASDPFGPVIGSYRVTRGGSWYGSANFARSASRTKGDPAGGSNFLGFRLSLRSLSK